MGIEFDLKEIGWEVVNYINPTQDKGKWQTLVKAVMDFRVS